MDERSTGEDHFNDFVERYVQCLKGADAEPDLERLTAAQRREILALLDVVDALAGLDTDTGAPMRESNINEVIGRISTRAGVKFTAHAFRHTFATDLLRAGVSREVVQHLLGHRRAESTMIYEHLNLDDLRSGQPALDARCQPRRSS